MTQPIYTTQPDSGQQVVDQHSSQFGVAVRDIFSDAGWTPVETVRARDWRDVGAGTPGQSSETTFD